MDAVQRRVRRGRRARRAATRAASGDAHRRASRRSTASSRRTSSSAAGRRRSCAPRRTSSRAKDKALVGTIPTYEECAGYAEMMGNPVRAVPLDADFKMDLGKMADAAKGAGLVFYCNPNNPTATYVGARATRDFLAKVQPRVAGDDDPRRRGVLRLRHRSRSRHAHRRSPSRTRASSSRGRSRRRTAWPACAWATRSATRTRSRRCATGTAARGTSSLNVLAMHAGDRRDRAGRVVHHRNERARNTAVRDFTMKWFADRGMKPTDSQANFMFVNIGRPVKEFRDACRQRASSSRATSRRSRRRTAASRSARWRR